MARRGIRKCEFCLPHFATYPVRVATLIFRGRPCCKECKQKLEKREAEAQ